MLLKLHTLPQLSFQKENVKSENGFNYITLCEVINLFLVVVKMMKSRKSFKNIVRTVVNPKSTEAYENSIGRSQGYLYVLFISYADCGQRSRRINAVIWN